MKNEVTLNTNDVLPTKQKLLILSHERRSPIGINSYVSKNGKLDSTSPSPFRHYLINVLKSGDKEPRGQFFKGKRPGPRTLMMDEFWLKKY
ncbi:hypothetical protein [Acinetobacter soli]|uniref:hypothetical protein n=1 Tax=Acinetobacter soli TaxID=487316 RepID=UPI001BA95883|nr:hypothetical protein [Acinetobacter soli]